MIFHAFKTNAWKTRYLATESSITNILNEKSDLQTCFESYRQPWLPWNFQNFANFKILTSIFLLNNWQYTPREVKKPALILKPLKRYQLEAISYVTAALHAVPCMWILPSTSLIHQHRRSFYKVSLFLTFDTCYFRNGIKIEFSMCEKTAAKYGIKQKRIWRSWQ